MVTNKTKTKVSFEENLKKITSLAQPVPTSALYALSNMEPHQQNQFEAAWAEMPVERRRKIAGSLADLSEEVAELVFESVFSFLLHDSDAEVRGKAVEGLAEDESRQTLGEFLKLVESDPSPSVREKAAAGLSRFALLVELGRLPQRWSDRLRQALFSQQAEGKNEVEVQRRLVEALGYFTNNDQVTRIIEKAYQSDDELLMAGALRAMGRNMNPRWLPEIGKELSNDDPLLRYEAVRAVGEMGSAELLPSVIKLLKDEDREVQLAVIWALGQVGGPEASRILKGLIGHENSTVREAAQEALDELIDAQNFLNPLARDFQE